jgi:hypothetical protein
MKTTLPGLCIALLLCIGNVYAQELKHTEKTTKEFTFEKKDISNTLIIENINGSIQVTGYSGDKIIVEVTRTVRAKTQARFDKAKEEINMGVIDLADTIILYSSDGCRTFGRSNANNRGRNGWSYNWNEKDCNTNYDYELDFVVKVPAGINIDVSTVNNGDVAVQGVSGVVIANNINGSIKLQNLVREAEASTINGNLDVEYTTNPKNNCRFYSLNGDINALFQKGLAAELSFESFNGNLYTNIDKIEALPARIEKSDKGNGIRYKINDNLYRTGKGGILLDFETFNGNVYLKERN